MAQLASPTPTYYPSPSTSSSLPSYSYYPSYGSPHLYQSPSPAGRFPNQYRPKRRKNARHNSYRTASSRSVSPNPQTQPLPAHHHHHHAPAFPSASSKAYLNSSSHSAADASDSEDDVVIVLESSSTTSVFSPSLAARNDSIELPPDMVGLGLDLRRASTAASMEELALPPVDACEDELPKDRVGAGPRWQPTGTTSTSSEPELPDLVEDDRRSLASRYVVQLGRASEAQIIAACRDDSHPTSSRPLSSVGSLCIFGVAGFGHTLHIL
jgi:hypothetical protein